MYAFTEGAENLKNHPVNKTRARALQYGPRGDSSLQLAFIPRCFIIRPVYPLINFLAIVQRVARQDPIFRQSLSWVIFRKDGIHRNFVGHIDNNGNYYMYGMRGVLFGTRFRSTMPTLMFVVRDFIRQIDAFLEGLRFGMEDIAELCPDVTFRCYGDDVVYTLVS